MEYILYAVCMPAVLCWFMMKYLDFKIESKFSAFIHYIIIGLINIAIWQVIEDIVGEKEWTFIIPVITFLCSLFFVKKLRESPLFLLQIIVMIVQTSLLFYVLEASVKTYDQFDENVLFRTDRTIALNLITIIILMSIMWGITGKWWIAELLVVLLVSSFAIANYFTMIYHGTFLTLEDIYNIRTVHNVISSYKLNIDATVLKIILVMLLCLVITFISYKYDRYQRKNMNNSRRIIVFVASLVSFFTIYVFRPTSIPVVLDAWSWPEVYANYGFVAGVIESSMANLGSIVTKPEGYSDVLVEEIANKYLNDNSDNEVSDSETYPDIFFILNESYYDMNYMTDAKADCDVMKNYNALENAIKGHTIVPLTSGGTNSSEYEMLTSNSMKLLNIYAPFNRLNMTSEHSAVDYLESIGYTSIGIHPSYAMNYHRKIAWEQLGFDETHFIEDFSDVEYYGKRTDANRITDISAFKNAVRFYESMPKDKPRFTFLLTMQNHGDWYTNSPEDNLVRSGRTFEDETLLSRLNEYLSCGKLTDEMIAYVKDYFTELYEKEGRKVVVCMTGDHSPTFVYLIPVDNLETISDPAVKYRATPFFIWANFPIDTGEISGTDMDLCYLTPLMFKTAGLPLSGYFRYLLDMKKEISVFTNVGEGYFDKEMVYHKIDYENDVKSQILRNYLFLEYNNCGDDAKRNEVFFTPKEDKKCLY